MPKILGPGFDYSGKRNSTNGGGNVTEAVSLYKLKGQMLEASGCALTTGSSDRNSLTSNL